MSQGTVTSYTQDDVAVFDGFTQVFRTARPLKASVRDEAKLMEHPLERGAMVTDHKVHQPVEIALSCVLEAGSSRDTYAEIKRLFVEGKLLTVQTRSSTYDNMAIQGMPHEESPDMFDVLTVEISLKEVLLYSARFVALPQSSVRNKTQSSTVQSGEKQAQAGGSWLSTWYGG